MREVLYQALVIPTKVGIQAIGIFFLILDSRLHGNDEINETNESNGTNESNETNLLT
jgi:hypothetical protein